MTKRNKETVHTYIMHILVMTGSVYEIILLSLQYTWVLNPTFINGFENAALDCQKVYLFLRLRHRQKIDLVRAVFMMCSSSRRRSDWPASCSLPPWAFPTAASWTERCRRWCWARSCKWSRSSCTCHRRGTRWRGRSGSPPGRIPGRTGSGRSPQHRHQCATRQKKINK